MTGHERSGTADLTGTVQEEFVRYIEHLAGRVERALRSLPADKVYVKPYPYGNSVGHLVLHLTGNLNHYIGAGIVGTGYVRDRPREFTEPTPPAPEAALERFREAVAMVIRTVRSLDAAGWQVPVSEQQPIQTRFGLVLVCAAHLNNHIGQMAYLVQALGHSTQEPPVW
jgi:uncharacterized damage-inducible protein DinB